MIENSLLVPLFQVAKQNNITFCTLNVVFQYFLDGSFKDYTKTHQLLRFNIVYIRVCKYVLIPYCGICTI